MGISPRLRTNQSNNTLDGKVKGWYESIDTYEALWRGRTEAHRQGATPAGCPRCANTSPPGPQATSGVGTDAGEHYQPARWAGDGGARAEERDGLHRRRGRQDPRQAPQHDLRLDAPRLPAGRRPADRQHVLHPPPGGPRPA